MNSTPQHSNYDVVIIGGVIMGSSTAWFLTENPDFNGRVLVAETAEWLTNGEYRNLDLTPFHYERIEKNRPIMEKAVI